MKIPKEIVLNIDLVKTHGVMVGYIYSILKINSSISRDELANLCNTSVSTIKRTINYMVDQKIINRIESSGKENTYQVIPLEGEQVEQPPKQREPKQPYGDEGLVTLTQTEYKKLIKEFGTKHVHEYIKRMEEEYHRSGKIYSDCYFMLRKWILEDKKNPAYRRQGHKKTYAKGGIREQEMQNIDQYQATIELFTIDNVNDDKKGDEE